MTGCKIEKERLITCKSLSLGIDDGYIKLRRFVDIQTGEASQEYAIIHGNDKKRGVVMNFCPYCGSEIFDKTGWKKVETIPTTPAAE